METWKATVRVTSRTAKVLVTNWEGDVLRARLPLPPPHPRALLTLLEGVALWSGAPLCVAISVAESVRSRCDEELLGGHIWPADSALVRIDFAEARRLRRLRGLGSFRDVLGVHYVHR
jgi:hypothetical protein